MTDRDPMPNAPTCPLCGENDSVTRERDQWLCGACWTVFTGGQGEWEQTRDLREKRASAYRWIAQRAAQEADA